MTRHSYTKTIYGNCSFELIEKYETAEKAAKGQDGQFVEVKLNDVKIEFNKVRKIGWRKSDKNSKDLETRNRRSMNWVLPFKQKLESILKKLNNLLSKCREFKKNLPHNW